MTHFSDGVAVGAAYPVGSGVTLGIPVPKVAIVSFGAVAATASNAIVDAYTATQATTLSATGTLVSGGVATFDVPRNVSILATGSMSGFTYTVSGTDQYGVAMTEAVLGPTGAAAARAGVKAFKTVTSITTTGANGQAISIGTGSKLGAPYRVADKGKILGMAVDGVLETSLTIVAGYLTTSNASTATTADVRGTVTAGTAPNGAKAFTLQMLVDDADTSKGLYGLAQA
jgi:hypothetical protein